MDGRRATRVRRSIAAALIWLAAAAVAPAAAQNQCFAPADLASEPGERRPVKGDHAFDRAPTAPSLAPFEPVAPALRGAIRRVKLPAGAPKLIALTFDLCEQPGEVAGYDGVIFDYLRAQQVPATLFAGGKWMRSHDRRLQQLLADPLFEIGNHSEAHRNLRLLAGTALKDEIEGPQRAYEAARTEASASLCYAKQPKLLTRIPQRLSLFRFPYGACSADSLAAVNDAGLIAIQWDLSTGDPSPAQSAAAISRAMLTAKPGSILIAHANGRGFHTAEALPLAIPALKAKGFRFVTVSELLAAGTPEIVPTCYDSRPGDTDKYDHPHPLALHAKPEPRNKKDGTPPAASPDDQAAIEHRAVPR